MGARTVLGTSGCRIAYSQAKGGISRRAHQWLITLHGDDVHMLSIVLLLIYEAETNTTEESAVETRLDVGF